jgi:hypothetical protein
MKAFAYPEFDNRLRRRSSLEFASCLLKKTRDGVAKKPSDAGLLRTANHWCRPMVFRTMADPLWRLIVAFCILPVLLLATLSVVSGAWSDALGAQCVLACGAFVSLRLLGQYPMLNPVHAVVPLFQWWFGFGPAVCAVFWSWKGDSTRADSYLTGGMMPTLIVALGLPIYASAARWVLRHWKGPQLTEIAPDGPTYDMGTLARLAAVAVLAGLIVQVLNLFGLRAYATVNYLGGQVTERWWLVPFAEAGRLFDFLIVFACSLLATPNLRGRAVTRWVMLGVAIAAVAQAVTSGSKGLLVLPVFYFLVAFANWRRRLPWLVLVAALFGYLSIVEPFVGTMRSQAEKVRATTTSEREEIFSQGWRDFQIGEQPNRDVNVESLFRGIYPLAKKVADQSSLLDGPWKGQSLRDGFSALLPRALFPYKADSNMGNLFARELGEAESSNYVQNVAITIPFEVVGNYGWLAGLLSFAIIGVGWASFVAFVLTVPRMTTHPFTPYLVAFVMGIESSVGQFGNQLKMLLMPLTLLYLVCQMRRKRSSV